MPTPTLPTPAPDIHSSLTQAALEFISAREEVPMDQLLATGPEPLYFPYLDKTYWRVVAFYNPGDGSTKSWWIRRMGSRCRSGPLWSRPTSPPDGPNMGNSSRLSPGALQEMGPEETIQVAFWIAGEPKRDEQGRFAELAHATPEAPRSAERSRQSLFGGGWPGAGWK